MKTFRKSMRQARFNPLDVMLILAVTAFLYTLMEWLFIVSKTSFLSATGLGGKLLVLVNGAAVLTLLAALAIAPLCALYFLIQAKAARSVMRLLMCLVPALISAAMVLLLVDNATYTLSSRGVVSSDGVVRALYLTGFALLTLGLAWGFFRAASSLEKERRGGTRSTRIYVPLALAVLTLLCAVLPAFFNPHAPGFAIKGFGKERNLPHILLITVDGVNAEELSLYGAEAETTPFLEELAKAALVADNAFSNAQGTVGSTTSLLTGKYPADVRVLASTDILKGEDTYEHLPYILKAYGYHTVQLSFSYYADAYRVNIQDGFDEANGQTPIESGLQSALAGFLPTDAYYFLREMYTRITDRMGHILSLKKMENPFLQVTEAPKKFNDQEKLDYLLSLLEESEKPLFVHLHWMNTHGPRYYPEERVFSIDKDMNGQEKYDKDFYRDSILEFDTSLSRLYAKLEAQSLTDQTILVVGSDHTQRWSISRIPLLMRFPHGAHAARLAENAQNLDIAPTLLDYLDILQPAWMSGQSLLEEPDPYRPIYLAAIPESKRDPETNKVIYPDVKEPYFQFGKMTVIVCDHYYLLNFYKNTLTDGTIKGYKGSCPSSVPSREEALEMILDHLRENGFDTSELEKIEP